MDLQDFENIILLHVCRKPSLFKVVDHDYFKNIFVSKLFYLVKDFYITFNQLPFNVEDPQIEQIKELAIRNFDKVITNKDNDKETNLKDFITNSRNIITSNYGRYSKDWLEESIEKAWIPWEAQEKGFRLAIEYRVSQGSVSASNIGSVINKCFDLINQYSNVIIDNEESSDFYDPEAHKPTPVENLIDCGFGKINLWASGFENGGFKPGTLTVLVGEANIGKSIFLGNFAYGIMNSGFNVFLASLEMEVNEIYKRIGANAFDIDIDKYDEISNNSDLLKEKIDEYKKKQSLNDFFRIDDEGQQFKPTGILRSKKFSSATVRDISTFYREEEKRLGIKYHAIVLDYMTELDNSYNINQSDMYMYHKTNTNDMFVDAGRYQKAWITAHQLKGADFGADDLTLSSLSESRGIVHRPDNVWGIIQTPTMKLDGKYYLKNMKTRTGKHKNFRIELKINWNRMVLNETGIHLEPGETVS